MARRNRLGTSKKAGIDFAILRCGYGQSGEDVTFKRNYRKARAAGIPIGTYYFSYATTMEEFDGEVKHLQSLLEGKAFELPVYMDLNRKYHHIQSSQKILYSNARSRVY